MKKVLKDYLYAVPAGFAISLGGLAFLSCDNKAVGSIFFAVGLFIVLVGKFNLFTGKVCYAFENKPSYIFNLISIWLGNLTGALITGGLMRCTRLVSLADKCVTTCNTKINDGIFSLFLLGIMCNILIFIAVQGFNNGKSDLVKFLSLMFGVSVFVLCGFEHCVADMFYFTFANVWNFKVIGYLLVITAGNIVGGLLAWYVYNKSKNR